VSTVDSRLPSGKATGSKLFITAIKPPMTRLDDGESEGPKGAKLYWNQVTLGPLYSTDRAKVSANESFENGEDQRMYSKGFYPFQILFSRERICGLT